MRLAISPNNSAQMPFFPLLKSFFPFLQGISVFLGALFLGDISSFSLKEDGPDSHFQRMLKKGKVLLRFRCCDQPESGMSVPDIAGLGEGEVLSAAPQVSLTHNFTRASVFRLRFILNAGARFLMAARGNVSHVLHFRRRGLRSTLKFLSSIPQADHELEIPQRFVCRHGAAARRGGVELFCFCKRKLFFNCV